MNLVEVRTKQEAKEFVLAVPGYIYRNDPNYIPHLRQDVEKVFDPKRNPLIAEGGAVKRWMVKDASGQAVGRVAAFVNPRNYNENDQPTGGLGFFECIDNQDVANQLFDVAIAFLKAQGMEAVDGPINFGDRNMFWGCLIENFTDANSYGMNYNPPYYSKLFEAYGFKEYFRQLCYLRDMYVPVQPTFVRRYEQIMAEGSVSFRSLRGMPLDKATRDFRHIYNNAWGGHAGFKELSERGTQKIMNSLKPALDPDIIIFGYKGSEPIAFYVNIPELNEIFCYVKGNLNLMGKLTFLWHKWRNTPRTMVGIIFGVVRKYHGSGVEGAIIKYSEDHLVSLNKYERVVMNWIGDFNPKMLKVAEGLGGTPYRVLCTYRYLFDRNKPFERCRVAE